MTRTNAGRPLRVAMLIQGYLPLLGGAERQLASLAPLLQAHGLEVHVLTRRYAGLRAFETLAGVPVHRLPVPGPKAMAAAVYTATALLMLRQLRPDVLHAHELLSPTTTALAARRLWGTPILAKPLRGGALGDIARLRQKPAGARRLAALAQQVDAFAVISAEIDRELVGLGVPAERRLRLPNGVDTQRFQPGDPATRAARRAALDLPSGPLIVFSGRLAREKGLAGLLALWPRLRARHPVATLVILGSGPEQAALEALAVPGVRFGGRVDDMPAYLACADGFVLPSVAEGLSNALLEAMAAGLPVVATAVGGAEDVIQHGVSGWLAPPDAPEALYTGLDRVLGEADLRAVWGQAARAQMVRHYDLSGLAQRLAAVYARLARRGADTEREAIHDEIVTL